MLNRRLLRVKVMQILYAHYQNDETTIDKSEKELFHSISKSLDLYYLYILLLLELRDYAIGRIEYGRNKKTASAAEKNPNTKFVTNKILSRFAECEEVKKYMETSGSVWKNNPEIIKTLYTSMLDSQQYKDYMSKKGSYFDLDKKFIIKLLEKVIAYCETIYPTFEEQSIYWNDEVEFVLSMVIKTIKGMEEQCPVELMGEFKDEEDREFVKKLFRKAAINKQEYRDIIEKYSKNWEIDRVAFMDVIIMQIALAEIVEFKNIPIKVSMNEYIEIAKHYSTEKSGVFINGVLDKSIEELKSSDKIVKTGKGLME